MYEERGRPVRAKEERAVAVGRRVVRALGSFDCVCVWLTRPPQRQRFAVTLWSFRTDIFGAVGQIGCERHRRERTSLAVAHIRDEAFLRALARSRLSMGSPLKLLNDCVEG